MARGLPKWHTARNLHVVTHGVAPFSFDRFGPSVPVSPIVLSVPHAGREYPDALLDALRAPPAALIPLEDRHVDRVAHGARGAETMFVARRPRAWIDLNRDERERDPRVDEGASAATLPFQSVKIRSGLGLIPRRAGPSAELWRRRFTAEEVAARIAQDHRPYHAAVAAALGAARERFGMAVLLDIHSMPALGGEAAPRIVLGDRFGRSASAQLVGMVEAVARRLAIRTAVNSPYAGGHILARHGDPAGGIHAIQIEFDRTLYLDALTMEPSAGLSGLSGLLREMIDVLGSAIAPMATAAE